MRLNYINNLFLKKSEIRSNTVKYNCLLKFCWRMCLVRIAQTLTLFYCRASLVFKFRLLVSTLDHEIVFLMVCIFWFLNLLFLKLTRSWPNICPSCFLWVITCAFRKQNLDANFFSIGFSDKDIQLLKNCPKIIIRFLFSSAPLIGLWIPRWSLICIYVIFQIMINVW